MASMERTDEEKAEAFANSDTSLLETGNFADATITCGWKTWNVHKAILASRSIWFERAFYGSFSESTSGHVDLPEHKPEEIDWLLNFLYSKDLKISELNGYDEFPSTCIKLWIAADYFLVDTLRVKVTKELGEFLDNALMTICDNRKWDNFDQKGFEAILRAAEEAYRSEAFKSQRGMFIAFLWAARLAPFDEKPLMDLIDRVPVFAQDFAKIHVRGDITSVSPWVPQDADVEQFSRDKRPNAGSKVRVACKGCRSDLRYLRYIALYDPFEVDSYTFRAWCEDCAGKKRLKQDVPWR